MRLIFLLIIFGLIPIKESWSGYGDRLIVPEGKVDDFKCSYESNSKMVSLEFDLGEIVKPSKYENRRKQHTELIVFFSRDEDDKVEKINVESSLNQFAFSLKLFYSEENENLQNQIELEQPEILVFDNHLIYPQEKGAQNTLRAEHTSHKRIQILVNKIKFDQFFGFVPKKANFWIINDVVQTCVAEHEEGVMGAEANR